MADYSALFTFHPKSEKPIKAVTRYLPSDILEEDVPNEMMTQGFSVNVRQMTANRSLTHGSSQTVTLPLLLITHKRSEESQEVFKFPSLSRILNKVEGHSELVQVLYSVTAAKSSAISGPVAGSLLVGCGAVTCSESAPRRRKKNHPYAGGWRETSFHVQMLQPRKEIVVEKG